MDDQIATGPEKNCLNAVWIDTTNKPKKVTILIVVDVVALSMAHGFLLVEPQVLGRSSELSLVSMSSIWVNSLHPTPRNRPTTHRGIPMASGSTVFLVGSRASFPSSTARLWRNCAEPSGSRWWFQMIRWGEPTNMYVYINTILYVLYIYICYRKLIRIDGWYMRMYGDTWGLIWWLP